MIMCTEGEPLNCHRALLIARADDGLGLTVVHILANGCAESHEQATERLMARWKTGEEEQAYRAQADAIGYRRKR